MSAQASSSAILSFVMAQKARKGRPTIFSQRLADKICLLISTTSHGLRVICKIHKDLPNPLTVYRWLNTNEDFCKQYARAKEEQAQVIFDEILTISDTTQIGSIIYTRKGRKEARVGDMIEHRRLQIDARKWVLSRLLPKKYGERIEVDSASDPLNEILSEMKKDAMRIGPPEGR